MSLLDDARRSAEQGCGGWYSGQTPETWVPGCQWPDVRQGIHRDDCFAPGKPKIVAALEAAERLRLVADNPVSDEQDVANAAYDFVAALKGEEVKA